MSRGENKVVTAVTHPAILELPANRGDQTLEYLGYLLIVLALLSPVLVRFTSQG